MRNRKFLVDIVNLNSDASCLSSERWMKALAGGLNSELFQILNSYVVEGQKVNLGIIGSTLSEILEYNNECIELINANPDIFEIVLRPFVHSLSILWHDETFKRNFDIGEQLTKLVFRNVYDWYLPAEFALRNNQVYMIQDRILGTFIHPKRIRKNLNKMDVEGCGMMQSLQSAEQKFIGLTENYDSYYLEEIQKFSSNIHFEKDIIFGWRDGESPFLLPSSVNRELHFIKQTATRFNRKFLSECVDVKMNAENKVNSYPQNSLLPWMGGFRLYWYVQEVKMLEMQFMELSKIKKMLFMFLLNSDILSCTEKSDVSIDIANEKGDLVYTNLVLGRVQKNLDAEDILYVIKNLDDREVESAIEKKINPIFSSRIKARLNVLNDYFGHKNFF